MTGIFRESDGGIVESICPICIRPMRSDADAPSFCGLCSMAIDRTDTAPSAKGEDGEKLYFCCEWCLKIYSTIRSTEQ
jgi:hypothetical protein